MTDAEHITVDRATRADVGAWWELAAEVEPEFGAAMVTDPKWRTRLERHVSEGTAWCARRVRDAPMIGGMLLSDRDEALTIGWLAVRRTWRRRGAGRALVERALLEAGSRPVDVVTFGEDHPMQSAAQAARALYEGLGFVLSPVAAPHGPDGTSRAAYRYPVV